MVAGSVVAMIIYRDDARLKNYMVGCNLRVLGCVMFNACKRRMVVPTR